MQDLKKKYPSLMRHVRVTLLQSGQALLTQFDARLAQKAADNLVATGIAVRTGVRVTEVTDSKVRACGARPPAPGRAFRMGA